LAAGRGQLASLRILEQQAAVEADAVKTALNVLENRLVASVTLIEAIGGEFGRE
jgi:hypothetical protein